VAKKFETMNVEDWQDAGIFEVRLNDGEGFLQRAVLYIAPGFDPETNEPDWLWMFYSVLDCSPGDELETGENGQLLDLMEFKVYQRPIRGGYFKERAMLDKLLRGEPMSQEGAE